MPRRNDWAKGASAARRSANRATVVSRRRQKHTTNRLKLNPTVAKLVDRRIARQDPLKHQYLYSRHNIDNLPDVSTRVWPAWPRILQGDNMSERIGNHIKPSTCYIRGTVCIPAQNWVPVVPPAPDLNAARADIQLRLLCLSSKQFSDVSDVQANWTTGAALFQQLFRSAVTPQQPTGYTQDMFRHVNTDLFTVHADKKFSLLRGLMMFPDPTSSSGASRMPAIHKKFSFPLRVKSKILKYQEATAVDPSNYGPFIVAMFSFQSGAAPSNTAIPWVEFYTTATFRSD